MYITAPNVMMHSHVHTYPCVEYISYTLLLLSGTAPITNRVAMVKVNELECGVRYTIVAGGTLNGDLVGPRSSYGAIAIPACLGEQSDEGEGKIRIYVYFSQIVKIVNVHKM